MLSKFALLRAKRLSEGKELISGESVGLIPQWGPGAKPWEISEFRAFLSFRLHTFALKKSQYISQYTAKKEPFLSTF